MLQQINRDCASDIANITHYWGSVYNSPGARAINVQHNEKFSSWIFNETTDEFKLMWSKQKETFNGTPEFAVYLYYLGVLSILKQIKPNPLSISSVLTDDASIHFTVRFEKIKVFLELFFENEKSNPTEVILNVFKDTECISAHSGSLQYVLTETKKFVEKYHYQNIKNFRLDELSGAYTPESAFQNYALA